MNSLPFTPCLCLPSTRQTGLFAFLGTELSIKEGYYADLAIVNAHQPWNVKKENILYKCGWSPFEGYNFKSRVTHTFVNGKLVYANGKVKELRVGQRLLFERTAE